MKDAGLPITLIVIGVVVRGFDIPLPLTPLLSGVAALLLFNLFANDEFMIIGYGIVCCCCRGRRRRRKSGWPAEGCV